MKDRIFEIMIAGLTLVIGMQVYTLTSLNGRIDALSINVQDIDRRLARMEGAYSVRECHATKASVE